MFTHILIDPRFYFYSFVIVNTLFILYIGSARIHLFFAVSSLRTPLFQELIISYTVIPLFKTWARLSASQRIKNNVQCYIEIERLPLIQII